MPPGDIHESRLRPGHAAGPGNGPGRVLRRAAGGADIRCRWFQASVRSSSSRRPLPIHRFMTEFIRSAWTAERMILTPAARNTAPNAAVRLASRSCSTNFTRVPVSEPASAPPTARFGLQAAGRSFPDATGAPAGGGRCRGASARSCPGSRSAATRRGGWAGSRRAARATPGPATSGARERAGAGAGPQRADGPASRSRRPSTTTRGTTSPAAIRPG